MGKIYKASPVKLFLSLFSQQTKIFPLIEKSLSNKFGPIDFSSDIFDFIHTDYYEKEFGSNLKRKFISFKKLFTPDILWQAKLFTNKLEERFTKDSKRQINLDPGYMTQASLVLASTKNFSHRIYVNKGIYEEITLLYQNKSFKSLPWTYPDYQSPEYLDIFVRIRDTFSAQLKDR